MKTKTLLVTFTLWLAVGTACFASAMTGTWKLNEAKSKFSPGATRNKTVVYSSSFFKTKVTVDGTDAKGKPVHTEWTGNFDGKDYAVTGDPTSDMRAYTKVDDRTLNMSVKKNGKVIITGKVTVAADGKSRTVTTNSTNAKGKKVTSLAFYDRQ